MTYFAKLYISRTRFFGNETQTGGRVCGEIESLPVKTITKLFQSGEYKCVKDSDYRM